jgi:hypothetical protein
MSNDTTVLFGMSLLGKARGRKVDPSRTAGAEKNRIKAGIPEFSVALGQQLSGPQKEVAKAAPDKLLAIHEKKPIVAPTGPQKIGRIDADDRSRDLRNESENVQHRLKGERDELSRRAKIGRKDDREALLINPHLLPDRSLLSIDRPKAISNDSGERAPKAGPTALTASPTKLAFRRDTPMTAINPGLQGERREGPDKAKGRTQKEMNAESQGASESTNPTASATQTNAASAQPTFAVAEAAPVFPPEATPVINRAADDPALHIVLLPQSAHLSMETEIGKDLALHLRLHDGVADVRIGGGAAPLFESRGDELRVALAGEGLMLGNLDLTNKQEQPSHERQGELKSREDALPTVRGVKSQSAVSDAGGLIAPNAVPIDAAGGRRVHVKA